MKIARTSFVSDVRSHRSPTAPRRGARLAWAGVAACSCLIALAACSPSVEDRLEEVRALQAGNQMEESIPILIELIESGNREGEILYRYGRALSLIGRPERSVWALDAAREDPEWFVPASQQLAIDAHRGGNFEFAMEVFERLHEEAPEEGENDLFALLLEARVLLDSQNHFEEALELVDTILERFPEEEMAVRMKAVALLGLKRPDEAYELLRSSGIAPADAADAAKADAGAPGEEGVADVTDAKEQDAEEEDPGIYLEIEDESREAYWCAVRASFKREAGETDEATKIADECLGRFPNSTELITEAVKLYSGLGRFDRVREILEKAYEASPDNPDIRGAYVQYLGRMGETREVEKILRKTVDDAVAAGRGATVETASHWIDLAGFLMDHDRVGEALVAFDSANQIIGDSASPDLLLREAEALIRAKEYDQALEMAAKTPVEIHGQMLRGRIAFEKGEYQKALDELGAAALLWPDNAPIRYYRARAAESAGDFDLAIEEYRHAIRSDSTLSAARERLARLHLAEGNAREAAGILTFQSPRRPSTPSTWMKILMVEVETLRGTEPDLDIPPAPDFPTEKVRVETIRALGRGLRARTNAKVAAGVLAEFEKESLEPIRGAFLRERVGLLIEQGDIEGAVSEARAGLKARPDDLDTRVALGRALVAEGKTLDEAERLLRGAIEKRPDDVDGLTSLADLEARRGEVAAAEETYARALRNAPDHWAAMAPRIEQRVKAGKLDEAIEQLETFVARDAPYEGRAALELARVLPDDEANKARRIELTKRAIRFRAGAQALELLASLDPDAAAELAPPEMPEKPGAEAAAAQGGDATPKEQAAPNAAPGASAPKAGAALPETEKGRTGASG